MEIKYGLISSDSHGQLGKDAYTSRMSQQKWGDRIPHVIEVRDEKFADPVERWIVNGEIQGGNVCNCPTAMPNRSYYPQRWEEVPPEVYQPLERLKALDRDRIDAETRNRRACFLIPRADIQDPLSPLSEDRDGKEED